MILWIECIICSTASLSPETRLLFQSPATTYCCPASDNLLSSPVLRPCSRLTTTPATSTRTTIGFKAGDANCGTSGQILGTTGAAAANLSTDLTTAALRNGKAGIGMSVDLRDAAIGNQTKS